MNLPHDLRFLTHAFFPRALRRFGFQDQLLKSIAAAARFQNVISQALLGSRTKAQEAAIIEAVAELEIYLSQVVTSLSAQNECRIAIQAKLDDLTDKVLAPASKVTKT